VGIPEPYRFDPRRLPHEYIHFGYGLHMCLACVLIRLYCPLYSSLF
jgi:cytochrome P450